MDPGAEELRLFVLLQHIEPEIELALEPIDHGRVESGKALFIQQPIQPILALYQEMQPALTVIDVEGEKEFDPRRQSRYFRGLVLKRLALSLLVDNAAMDRPGIDDFFDGDRERRVQRPTTDRHDHAGDETAHRGELQTGIALVGETCFAGDASVDLLTPAADFFGREALIERLADNVANELADLRPGALDDRLD